MTVAQMDMFPGWLKSKGEGTAALAVRWGQFPCHYPPPEVPWSMGSLKPPWMAALPMQRGSFQTRRGCSSLKREGGRPAGL